MILKQSPEDFKVTEIIKVPKKDENGIYTYFWLEKTNYTTVRALQAIARALRISKRRLHFSGTKDKQAITKQLVSVMHLPPERLNLTLKDIKITPLHRGRERITLGSHTANHFDIIIYGLDQGFDSKSVKKVAKAVQKGYPNYFDEQRFSSNNADVGKALVKGYIKDAVELILSKDKESAKLAKKREWTELTNYYDKPHSSERTIASWLITQPNDYAGAFRNLHKKVRMLYVHSYQSALFNLALSSTIKGCVAKLKINNESLCVGPVSQADLILPGYKSELGKSDYDKKLASLLKKDGIKLEDFKMPRTPELASAGSTRNALVKPNKLKVGKLVGDSVEVNFDLPKGAYATLLAKVLFS